MKPHFKLTLKGQLIPAGGAAEPNRDSPVETMCALIRELYRLQERGHSPLPALWALHDAATTSGVRLVHPLRHADFMKDLADARPEFRRLAARSWRRAHGCSAPSEVQ